VSLDPFLLRPIVFFGGKGGVGKTTLAAAAALHSASGGARTLLVSTDPAHSTGDLFGTDLGPQPSSVAAGLWVAEIDPALEAQAYIDDVKDRVEQATPPRLVAEVERQLDVARVSPGAEEAALFERFARIMEESGRFERIVFDTAPTAQTLRLLSLPELMSAWISGLISRRRKVTTLGRMWRNVAGAAAAEGIEATDPILEALEERMERFNKARATLTDPERTAFTFVVVPERLPILETHRAMGTLARYGIPVGGLLVNQVLPDKPDGRFLRRRKEREAGYLAEIQYRFGDWPSAYVPLLDEDPRGVAGLRRLASLVRTDPAEESD
jgi:arsenite-transporting ATPase